MERRIARGMRDIVPKTTPRPSETPYRKHRPQTFSGKVETHQRAKDIEHYGASQGASGLRRTVINLLPANQSSAPRSGASTEKRIHRTKRPRATPPLHCSVCQIGVECSEFHEGYVCAFTKE